MERLPVKITDRRGDYFPG